MKLLFKATIILNLSLFLVTHAMEQEESATKKMKTEAAQETAQLPPARIPSLVQFGLTAVAKYVKQGKLAPELLTQLPKNIEEAVKFLVTAKILNEQDILDLKELKKEKYTPIPEHLRKGMLQVRPQATEEEIERGLRNLLALRLESSFTLKQRFEQAVQNAVLKLNGKTSHEEQLKIQEALSGLISLIKEDMQEVLGNADIAKLYLIRAASVLLRIEEYLQLPEEEFLFYEKVRHNALKVLTLIFDKISILTLSLTNPYEIEILLAKQFSANELAVGETRFDSWPKVIGYLAHVDFVKQLTPLIQQDMQNNTWKFVRWMMDEYSNWFIAFANRNYHDYSVQIHLAFFAELYETLKYVLPFMEQAPQNVQKSYVADIRYDILIATLRKTMNILDDYKNGKITETQLIKTLKEDWNEDVLIDDEAYDAKQAQK